jgi:IS605 OrfB family transposase
VKPGKVIVVVVRPARAEYTPEAVIALDTNEETLDGVLAAGESAEAVRVRLGGIKAIQARHFARRRRLAAKKANDLRIKRRLLAAEGTRESNRVNSRLHVLSKSLVAAAKERRAVIVLEDLTGLRQGFSHRLNRRLSSWPHRELHRQIQYKAKDAGVPVVFVSPWLTSRKCARCGWIPRRSDARTSAKRIGWLYTCGNPECRWRVNRQLNAGVNILRTALGERPGLGGVRFHLDALPRDVMTLLCEPDPRAAGSERTGREPVRRAAAPALRGANSPAGARQGAACDRVEPPADTEMALMTCAQVKARWRPLDRIRSPI